ncbi:hypothetical protein [Microbacterium sp. SD291]|uniref:hypothetical protein n=1 Tax=Microbacterium sp. SD291 TaxID=2782007 RepID=UPI001A96BA33|nr:hypothetical protein [Microbacterium sp. SD291]MBO0979511.1 hypothetical protein [Microbacterium sp. SD291]
MIPRTISAAAAALLLAACLVACSGAPDEAVSPTPKAPAPTPEASVQPVETEIPEPPAAEPACDTIVSEGTVKVLTDAGWTFEEKEFVIGDVTLDDGLLCFWADYSVASDHGQLYGWSEITAENAARAQSSLLSSGWLREDGPEGVYITEDPQYAMGVDEDGYGMTYLFGDGWVKFADTRQSLLLVGWSG